MRVSNTIYLDHQASTPVDPRVLEKMIPYYQENFANPHSSDHSLGWSAAAAIDEARSLVADFIGAEQDEITFTSGATEANNLAIIGHARHNLKGNRKRIIVSCIEHKCVLDAAGYLEKTHGYVIEKIPVNDTGHIDLTNLKNSVSDDVLIVSVGAVNNEVGTIQSVEAIAEIVHEVGAIFHCDAAQAPLAISLDQIADHADMLSLSAHKIYGPKGIGALYVRRDLKSQIEPLIWGGGQQDGLRSGTLPTPLCVGMGHALKIIQEEDTIEQLKCLKKRRNYFTDLLTSRFPDISLNGPRLNDRHPGNANLKFNGIDARQLLILLQPKISASMGSACASGTPEPSYVLRSMGLSNEEANSSIRFSLGYGTTEKDIVEATDIITETILRMQNAV